MTPRLPLPPSPPGRSYREVLRDQLSEKSRLRPGISLRAFARMAGVSHALLSLVLNGKKHLSRQSAVRIAECLDWAHDGKETFLDLVEFETSGDDRYRELVLRRLAGRAQANEGLVLTLASFRVVADWYHFPILELTGVRGFSLQPRAVAQALGIPELEARAAIDRLVALGLLVEQGGRLVKSRDRVTTTTGVPSRSVREHHRQMIGRSADAIEGQSVDQRYLTDMTVAIDRGDIPEVGHRLEEFKRELSEFLNRRPARDSVYQLNLQFFELTPKAPRLSPLKEKSENVSLKK